MSTTLSTQDTACTIGHVLLADVVIHMHAIFMRDNTAARAGGALEVSGATRLHASDCVFDGNTVFDNATQAVIGSGGALYFDGSAPATLSDITLVNKQAANGGAIYANNTANLSSSGVVMYMQAIVLRNNSAANVGGALGVSWSTQLHASDCLFDGNTVCDNANLPLNANQVSGSGGVLYLDGSVPVLLSNITLVNNQASYGGAIWAALNNKVNLSSSEVVMHMQAAGLHNNVASITGGAVYVSGATRLLVADCLFEGNTVFEQCHPSCYWFRRCLVC
jgi:predicted outer membrane repeat protein